MAGLLSEHLAIASPVPISTFGIVLQYKLSSVPECAKAIGLVVENALNLILFPVEEIVLPKLTVIPMPAFWMKYAALPSVYILPPFERYVVILFFKDGETVNMLST